MKTIEELYKDLEQFSDFSNQENIDLFLNVVENIVHLRNPESIDVILKFFNEDTEYGWVMTSLRKILENYPAEIYVEHVLNNIENLIDNSLTYTDEIVNSILNSKIHRLIFFRMINCADKQKINLLFNFMEKESPHHKQNIEELREILKQH
ncbi:MAG: hypothetical protein HEEMFOPI_01768 [Holosporales bacterium]